MYIRREDQDTIQMKPRTNPTDLQVLINLKLNCHLDRNVFLNLELVERAVFFHSSLFLITINVWGIKTLVSRLIGLNAK